MAVASLLIQLAFEPRVRSGIRVGLAAAWLAQACAFALLLAGAIRWQRGVVAGWTAGTLVRLATLAGLAWLSLGGVWALPLEPMLIALVAALFVLLILETVVFRYGPSLGVAWRDDRRG